jgi:hypothetical protein
MLACAVVAAAGCLQSSAVQCENGTVCPAGYVCGPSYAPCVLPEQLAACEGAADETACDDLGAPGVCRGNVCVREGCGDGFVRGAEECDPWATPTIESCGQLGYDNDAPVGCKPDCTFDRTACDGICGDGELDADEQCDGDDLGATTSCAQLGYYDAVPLTCNQLCRYDVTECTGFCGDHVVTDGHELCEDTWRRPEQCVAYGYDAGALGCNLLCTASFDDCVQIGWRSAVPPISGTFGDVSGTAANGMWMLQHPLALHRKLDGTWVTTQAAPSNAAYRLSAIWAQSASTVWAVGDSGTVRRWNGTSWVNEATNSASVTNNGIHGSSASDVWAVGSNGTVFKRINGVWNKYTYGTNANLLDVWVIAPDDVWSVGSVGSPGGEGSGSGVRHNGVPIAVGSTQTFLSVWASSASNVFAGDAAGTVVRWNGTSWDSWPVLGEAVVALWGSGPLDVWAVGDGGERSHFDGTRWRSIGPDTMSQAVSIWGSGPGDVWMTGSSLLHYGGSAFTTTAGPPGVTTLDAIGGTDDDNIWIMDYGAYDLWQFHGGTWTKRNVGGASHAWGTAWDDMWFAAGNSMKHWDGSTTTSQATGDIVNAVWGASSTDVWMAGSSLHHYTGTWTEVATTQLTHAMWGFGANDIWAVGSAVLHKTAAGWNTVTAPGTTDLFGVWGAASNDVWAVGEAGLVIHWNGTAWSAVDLGLTADLYDVWGTAADDVWIVGTQNTLLHREGGQWIPVRSPAAPETAFYSVRGSARQMIFGGDTHSVLERTVPWTCRATETACSDRTDDDCDAMIDDADLDCPP